jgi:pimeloyl-ACP methyl ester carboxylesterase
MADIRLGSMVMEEAGPRTGETVVMIHGLGGSSNSFQPQMGALADYRVLRPDLPGAGRSGLRPGLAGLPGLAQAIQDGLRAAGVKRAHFVGHSMGTILCQYLAAKNPDLVCSLTLFGPILEPPIAARQGLKERAAAARKDGMAGIADAVSQGSVSAASRAANPVTAAFVRESLMRQDPVGYASHCEALSAMVPADHSAIKCPTLLVAGDADPVAPVAMATDLKGRISNARLEIMPDVGHWMMIEAPERSTALLLETLEAAQA